MHKIKLWIGHLTRSTYLKLLEKEISKYYGRARQPN